MMENAGRDASIEGQFVRAYSGEKNDFGVAVRPHRNGIVLVFDLLIWIFMPPDGKSAGQPLKPRVAYPHPAHPIKAPPRDMHKKGLKLTRNRS